MQLNANIKKQVEELLNSKIKSVTSISGGCIADSKIITTKNGCKYFIKTSADNLQMFDKEANGLLEIAKSGAIAVPKVIFSSADFLLLENIEQGTKTANFFENFGKQLAQMHRFTANEYGFYQNNYIGLTSQYNIAEKEEKHNWAEFYAKKRLLPQLQTAKKKGLATVELTKNLYQIIDKIDDILQGSHEPPTLLHGDLWGGNYLINSKLQPALIDPAVYYGHREADLAMTVMFGGFSAEFYKAYDKEYPLKQGWVNRQNIYLLYHYLNHLNLFGNSYYSGCVSLSKSYCH